MSDQKSNDEIVIMLRDFEEKIQDVNSYIDALNVNRVRFKIALSVAGDMEFGIKIVIKSNSKELIKSLTDPETNFQHNS